MLALVMKIFSIDLPLQLMFLNFDVCNGCLTGMGYPAGKNTLAGAGMGKI